MAAATSLVDLSFIDARARVIDVAAFLDRLQRHGQDQDFRVTALKKALRELLEETPDRAERVLLSLSDHSLEPVAKAPMQGALGAVPPEATT
jgi:two-component sensor histidine kinase